MKNSVNKRYVPKLRFRGFEGEYSFEILNKYLEYEQPTKYLILNNENINEIGNVPVLTANKSFILGYVENELNNCYKKGECFIFDDFTTDIKYVNFLFKLRSSAAKIITTKNDNYINYFFYLLKSKKPETLGHKRHWIEITSKEKRFIPPTLKEQEKISIFLSLLDKQISLLENKLKLTEQLKHNYLENLFANKSNTPKLRFKGFENNYNKKTINDCFVILNGLSGLKAENFKYGNDKYIPYKTVFNNWFINNNELEFFEKGTKKQNEVTKNDILITSSSETLNEIGYSSIYLDNEKVYLNSFCFILRNISKEVNSQYFNWLMKNKHYRKLIVNEGQGSTRYNLQKKQFKNIVFNFPLLEEQTKISNFLLLLDKQIDNVSRKIEVIKNQKKFFLNNLFI